MVGALSDGARLTSVCRVHRAKSRTERSRKTKIGREVGHVTHDSESRTPLSSSKGQLAGGRGILWRPPAQLVK